MKPHSEEQDPSGKKTVQVRKLEDRRGLEKPDRANAAWQKKSEQNDDSKKTNVPQQIPEKVFKDVSEHQEGAPVVERRRRQSRRKGIWNDDSERTDPNTPKWLLGVFTLTLTVLAAFLLVPFLTKKSAQPPNDPPDQEQRLDDEIAAMNFGPVTGPLPHVVAKSFVETADPQERLKYCRDPERLASLIATFPEQALSEIPVAGEPLAEITVSDLSIQVVNTLFENGETRSLFVVRTEDGPKVDWEAYARHSRALETWMNEASDPKFERDEETAEVRVHVVPDNYYNFRFMDDQIWRAYRIINSDMKEAVTAYVARGTATEKILTTEITSEKRMTLRLRSRSDDARKKQYEIEKVLAVGWVKSEGDFEARWLRENSN